LGLWWQLILNSGAVIVGANETNYIFNTADYGLKMKGVTSAGKIFPMGINGSNSHPITVKPTSTTDFLVKLKPTFTDIPLAPLKAVTLEWDITPSTAPGTTTLIFKPHSSKLSMDNTPGNAAVGHFTAGAWVEHSATYDAMAGTWTYIHSGSFSPFGVGVAGAYVAVLKAELIDFKATLKDAQALLTWQTASETDVKNFDIEKSTDGQKFEKIATVKANNTPSVYSAFDDQFLNGSYYRLKINDLDGSSKYSKVVFLEKGSSKSIKIRRDTEGSVFVETDDKIETITVTNTIGQVVKTTKDKQFSMRDLMSGLYIISVKTDKGYLSEKVFKE
jgi:hypothetical protein